MIGKGSILIDFLLSILVVFLLATVLTLMLDVSGEISMSIVLFGAIGWTFVNLAADKISLDSFEQNCSIESLKQRARSAVRYKKT